METDSYHQQVEQMASATVITLPLHFALVVVDMVNDGCRDGGAFQNMGFDISRFQAIERPIERLVKLAREAGGFIVYSTMAYDMQYLPTPMTERFNAMGVEDVGIARKGSWGAQLVDTLPADPDMVLVKSHFSPFSLGHSLLYDPKIQSDIAAYMKRLSDDDELLRQEGRKTLADYYKEALISECSYLGGHGTNGEPNSLYLFLLMKRITTLVLVGGSTNVCLGSCVHAAAERGIEIILPIDAITSEDESKHWSFLHNFGLFNAKLTTVDNLVKLMKVKGAKDGN